MHHTSHAKSASPSQAQSSSPLKGALSVPLGQVVATPGALAALEAAGQNALELLARHARGDWGTVDSEDWAANDQALQDGSRILSAYLLNDGTSVWVITEADRSSTMVLLPEDY